MTSRDAAFESEFLTSIHRAAKAQTSGFHAGILRQLRKGAEEHGDNAFLQRSPVDLIREGRDELEDCPAWLMLAAQRLESLEQPDREQTVAILIEAGARCMEAWTLLEMALEDVETPRRSANASPQIHQPPVRLCSEA